MLVEMIAEVTGETPRELRDEARLSEDLHLDSLARVQLQSLLESGLVVEVSDDAIAQMQTLGELRDMIGGGAAETEPSHAMTEGGSQVQVETVASPPVSGARVAKEESLSYLRWPWSWPMQLARAVFLELVAQPLIWLLAAPRVVFETDGIPQGPMLIIGNHVTAYDGPLILYALKGRLRRRVAIAMSAELLGDLRRGRGQGSGVLNALAPIGYWLITALYNVFPLPRRRGFRRSFAHAGEGMDRGYSVMIFPEGHRSETGRLQRFREGTGLLAKESQVPVLPVALRGLGELKASGRWVRSGKLEVHVGASVQLGPDATAAEWTAALEAAVQRLAE
jgi:long-chain acyl-CoA synthetase